MRLEGEKEEKRRRKGGGKGEDRKKEERGKEKKKGEDPFPTQLSLLILRVSIHASGGRRRGTACVRWPPSPSDPQWRARSGSRPALSPVFVSRSRTWCT